MRTADQWLIGAFGLLLVILVSLCVSTSLACFGFIESWSCKKNGIGFGSCLILLLILGGLALADLIGPSTFGRK